MDKTITFYPIVEVEWRDAASTHGWRDPAECKKESGLVICDTVGYLVHRDRKELHMLQSVNEHGKVSEEWTIPVSQVIKVRVLKRQQHAGRRSSVYHKPKPKKKRR